MGSNREYDRDIREMRERGGDLVLAQGEQALVQNGADGTVEVHVGPTKTSIGETDNPVRFDSKTQSFQRCLLKSAVTMWPAAKEGQYIVLQNPVEEDEHRHPSRGKQGSVELAMGRRVNIPGPATFALYPGQSATCLDGHILRSNQYLVVRVINGEVAKSNWKNAVLKKQTNSTEEITDENKGEIFPDASTPDLVTGQLLVVKGTEVSFYIPPTGMEVVPECGKYVRDAVTLEQLETCILIDENGTKEYVNGPAVVFPRPTQSFHETHKGERKIKAIELETHRGLYVKVIKPYEEDGKKYAEGEELFITGKDQKIYYPRPEHAIIKYGGDQLLQQAVAIPKGEARYVLSKETGDVKLVLGPKMYLPDPRYEVIVRRTLPIPIVELLYPGNEEAVSHNLSLLGLEGIFNPTARKARSKKGINLLNNDETGSGEEPELTADEFTRSNEYVPPRSIQLKTKYDGAVTVRVHTGYAIKVVSKTGESRVIEGPQTVLLQYDELPEVIELSTGTPKSDYQLRKDVYLRVKANKVSDLIAAETGDFVSVRIPLSFRVDFEGDKSKWFDVENYVKFLTDHTRSLVANVVKKYGVQEFYTNYIDILRNAILGETVEGKRPGRLFPENGMRVYDVEFGKLEIGDSAIAEMVRSSQKDSVEQSLRLAMARKELETVREEERIRQELAQARAATKEKELLLQQEEVNLQLGIDLAKINAQSRETETELSGRLASQTTRDEITKAELARQKSARDQQIQFEEAQMVLRLQELGAQAEAFVKRFEAIQPDLVAAIKTHGNQALAGKLAEHLPQATGGLGLLLGRGGMDALSKMIAGTGPLAEGLKALTEEEKEQEESGE
mgnify:CR=1 FL=1